MHPHTIRDASFFLTEEVSLLFSPEDTASVVSKKNVKFWLDCLWNTFPLWNFKWALAQRTQWRFWTLFTYGFLFAWYSFIWHLQWFLEVFLGPFSNVNDRIMQMNDAVSSDWLKTTGIQQSSMKKKDFSNFSESFDDIMHCRWWYLQSLCNLTLRNVVFKVFHNLFTHSFTDWRPSAHLYFCETLPL